MNIQKKKIFGGGVGSGWGGQGGCEWRSEAFVKIQKKIIFFFLGGGGGVWSGGGGGVRLGGGVRVGGGGGVRIGVGVGEVRGSKVWVSW